MRYAVIAAGEGSRLAQEGMTTPKPLVKIGGECMVDRLVRIFVAAGAKEVCVVCNPSSEAYIKSRQEAGAPLRSIVRITPSSMHSMYELMPMLEGDEPFVLTTVDTVFRESEFQDYVAAFEKMVAAGEADGLMGVTTYIDDEKPLYVATDDDLNIRAFLDADENPRYVSGGIYGLTPCALATLRRCVDRGESRMRNFQRALLSDGLQLKAFPFTKVIDVDHACDIAKAEALLR
jgi:NDP-sugar pyrophosphorylase family protein